MPRYSYEAVAALREDARKRGVEDGKRVALELVLSVFGLTGYEDETAERYEGWSSLNGGPPSPLHSTYIVPGWSRLYADLEAARDAVRGEDALARVKASLPKAGKP